MSCVKWGDYIKKRGAKTSYYQPLQDCLDIVPNNLDIPWEKAIITEGPCDALTLEVMQVVLNEPPSHAIYPGTSSNNLDNLISLNIGWRADFTVLLDSDADGKKHGGRYLKEYALEDRRIVHLPGNGTEIEDMLTDAEKSSLHEIAFGYPSAKVSKKEFLATMRTLAAQPTKFRATTRKALSDDTKDRFRDLFRKLKL